MEMMDVKKLIPHDLNTYYFDDMDGEPWVAFLESIETSGIIEPIIVTQDLVIVSGHQRVRAAKKLGIEKVAVEVRVFDSEDEILKQLIETNVRQRGIGNTNAVKLGRCIAELERLYGIRNGGDRKSDGHNVQAKTQDELANELEMSKRQMSRFKSLTDLIPELQDAVQSGQITATTAMGFVKKLSPEEQKQIAEQIAGKGKMSKQEIDQRIKFYKDRVDEQQKEINDLRKKQPGIRVVEKEVEVIPSDYEELKQSREASKKEYANLRKEYDRMADKWKQAEHEKKSLLDEIHRPENEKAENIKRSALFFCAGVANFIEKYGGYVWLTQELDNMEKAERDGYIKAIDAVYAWSLQMKENVRR